MGCFEFGYAENGNPGGLVIKGLLGPLSTKETFGAQSQYSVRERTRE